MRVARLWSPQRTACDRAAGKGMAGDGHPGNRQPFAQTVHPATVSGPNCASGDSPRHKLCIWRQPRGLFGHFLSSEAQFVVRAVAGGTVCRVGCRQMHSLAPTLSPEAQSGRRGRTNSTAGDNKKPDSTVGDSWGPIWPPSCRRHVSLGRALSPAHQSGRLAVAGGTVCRVGCRRSVSLGNHQRVCGRDVAAGNQRHAATRDSSTPLAFGSLRSG